MATQTTWGPLKALIERFDEHNFGRTEIQRLVENADALVQIGNGTITREVISQIIEQMTNPYAKEKVELRYFYPKDWKPTTVTEQVAVLQQAYADFGLDGSHVEGYAAGIISPVDVDGRFVFPKPSSIAAKLAITVDPPIEGYGQLLEGSLMVRLANQRKFKNYRAGELTPDRVRMRQSAAVAIRKIEEEQPEGDFMVIAAQTGQKWGGYSPRNSRWEMERGTTEFPLPAWVVGHIVLTNPSRLDKNEHLFIDCPGDEYRFEDDAEFDNCLYFNFNDGQLKFNNRWLNNANDNCGSASGFSGLCLDQVTCLACFIQPPSILPIS